MVGFSDLLEVQAELDALAARADPLVVRLARGPGQKEDRYAQLLGAPAAVPASGGRSHGSRTAPADEEDEHGEGRGADGDLRAEVAALRAEVGVLRRALDDLRAQLGA
jgi:hypothetical protein